MEEFVRVSLSCLNPNTCNLLVLSSEIWCITIDGHSDNQLSAKASVHHI